MTWSEAQVFALTDDTPTLQNGKKLASPAKWSNLGADGHAVWGECQGSGKDPYRVAIDRSDMGSKCTCPSRKFPCKHSIGLFLLFASRQDLFSAPAPAPNWLTTWLDGRQKRREKSDSVDKPIDSEAQARRQEAREDKVRAGMTELRRWLSDVARHGLADDRLKTYEFWDRMAARMVDAQASGIARRLRALGGLPFAGRPDWAARMLDEISRLYLLTESYDRLDSLPPDTQHDVRTLIGWAYKGEELLALPTVRDRWIVRAQYTEVVEDRLKVRRVWLYGTRTGRAALLLDFAHGGTPFDGSYPVGQSFDGELIYYPGAYPQRAILKAQRGGSTSAHDDLTGLSATIDSTLDAYATALAANPWLDPFPLGLSAVTPYQDGERFYVRDSAGHILPIRFASGAWWTIAAASGGHPIAVFGEWDGYDLTLRTVRGDGIYFSI